jgi:signal peptidase I
MTAAFLALGAFVMVAVWLRYRYRRVTVAGDSMRPTLHPGDRVLVHRTRVDRLARNDLVVFAAPYTAERTWMIKRVLAIPGDPLPRREIPTFWSDPNPSVPANHYVVLGDNPDDSYDSRTFGFLHASGLLGVVISTARSGRERTCAKGSRRTCRGA